MSRAYEKEVNAHYDSVADQAGLSAFSTMADEIVRARETEAILHFVGEVTRHGTLREADSGQLDRGGSAGLRVLDAGCGNGYTLRQLATALSQHCYFGIEPNKKLARLAREQVAGMAEITEANILEPGRVFDLKPDLIISQRMLINILDRELQRRALENIVMSLAPGGHAIFIEVFKSGLDNLNAARAEFGLEAMPPAHHNLPLPNDFFDHPGLEPMVVAGIEENMLSTHYFVARVLHECLLRATGSKFTRNSHFVRFFSAALPSAVGEFSPLRFRLFKKVRV